MMLENNYAIRDHWLRLVQAVGLEDVCSTHPQSTFKLAGEIIHDRVVEARVIEKMFSWTPAPNAAGGALFPPDCLTLVLLEMTPPERQELKSRLLTRRAGKAA